MPLPLTFLLGAQKRTLRWLINLGGPGLILLGLADNSVVPMPGSTDVATIVLSAHHRGMWIYYAMMATAGAVLGGFLTFRMARKGGQETLEKKLSGKQVEKVYRTFERWGFASVAISALLPPPFPIVPILLAAGALQYPTKRFICALTLGRGIRYTILAYLGLRYGNGILGFFSRYYWPVLIVLISLSVIASSYGYYQYKRRQKDSAPPASRPKVQTRRRVA